MDAGGKIRRKLRNIVYILSCRVELAWELLQMGCRAVIDDISIERICKIVFKEPLFVQLRAFGAEHTIQQGESHFGTRPVNTYE